MRVLTFAVAHRSDTRLVAASPLWLAVAVALPGAGTTSGVTEGVRSLLLQRSARGLITFQYG